LAQHVENNGQVSVKNRTFKCPECDKSFEQNFTMKRHVREVHHNPNRKTMKHIRDGEKILCPICHKDFTHSAILKNHIIKLH
jgi:uncharacterized C2H2 Zn-finger protein